MTKVKILLSAITVLAEVGVALAFKARKLPLRTIYITSPAKPNVCDVAVNSIITYDDQSEPIKYTLTQSSPCINGFTTDQEF